MYTQYKHKTTTQQLLATVFKKRLRRIPLPVDGLRETAVAYVFTRFLTASTVNTMTIANNNTPAMNPAFATRFSEASSSALTAVV